MYLHIQYILYIIMVDSELALGAQRLEQTTRVDFIKSA